VDGTYINEDHALFGTDDNYHRVKKELLLAIESARNTKHVVHFAGLTNVSFDTISNYFVPFARYARNPSGNAMVLAMNENNMSTTYYIPQNLWIILNLAPSETLDAVPEYISDLASVNSFEFALCDPVDTHTDIKRFKYPQFDHLNGKIKTIAEIDEDNWKKLDRLEEYVNSHAEYSFGNKLWTGFEKYIATYIACDGERKEAMDKAISARLLTSMITSLSGHLSEEDQSLSDTLDTIFGEENTAACRRMIQIASEKAEETDEETSDETPTQTVEAENAQTETVYTETNESVENDEQELDTSSVEEAKEEIIASEALDTSELTDEDEADEAADDESDEAEEAEELAEAEETENTEDTDNGSSVM
jgi:hypothetical protein